MTVELTNWAIQQGCEASEEELASIIPDEQLRVFPSPADAICYHAAKAGRLDLLKWVYPKVKEDRSAANGATESGKMELVTWLFEQGCEFNDVDYYIAGYSGHFDVVKEFHKRGVKGLNMAMLTTAESGANEIVKWGIEVGEPITSSLFHYAARGNNIPLLDYLHGFQQPQVTIIFESAARVGNLEAMKWLLEKKYPYDYLTTVMLIARGDLELLKEMQKIGFKFDDCLMDYAYMMKPEILEWAKTV